MARLFVAIDVPDAAASALEQLRTDDLDVRWTPRPKYHMTLRFIGDVGTETIPSIKKELADFDGTPLSLQATGLDVFPSRSQPRVIVARFQRIPALLQVQDQVEAAVQRAGLSPDTRRFSPHVTLARNENANLEAVRAYLQQHSDVQLSPFSVDTFHLYESTLHPDGAQHDVVATYPLSD